MSPTLTPQSGTVRQDTAYAYDLAGNITATQERAPQSGVGGAAELERLFEYDALYRLLEASGRENQPTAATPWQDEVRSDGVASTTAYTQHYAYDLLGNITELRHVAASSPASFTRTFDYGSQATNYLQSVQVGGTVLADYAYDANGNAVRETQSRHLGWDASDQLRQFATWTGTAGTAPTLLAYYVYDAGGQRTKKITQTSADTWQVSVYVGGGFEHRYEVSGGQPMGEQTVVAVLDGQSRLYQRRGGDALDDQRPAELYTLEDHLGSATATVDGSGVVVSREEYYPFGETSFGAHARQRYRFCGKERDQESGLYYYGMRYYTPWVCRFVSVDPLAAKFDFYTPYQYAGNKPINFIDLDGAEPAPPNTPSAPPSNSSVSNVDRLVDFVQKNSMSGLLGGLSLSLENLKPAYTKEDRFGEPNLAGDGQPGEGKAMIRGLIGSVQGTLGVIAHPIETAKSVATTTKKTYSYLINNTAGKMANDAVGLLKSTSRTNDSSHLEREEAALNAAFTASTLIAGPKILRPASETVNLASAQRTVHILAGDATGGGHAWFSSAKSFRNGVASIAENIGATKFSKMIGTAKSMFPATWSEAKIMNAVSEVAVNNPWIQKSGSIGSFYTKAGAPSRFVVFGTYEGVKIKVVVTGMDIITAHPVR